jgi:YHS domain-containing protein
MKRLILSAALLAFAAGCNNSSNTQPPEQSNNAAMPTTAPASTQASATQKPINKYCAVNRDEEVDPTVTYLYQGKVIGFCCDDCVPKFKQDPEKYMKGLK